MKYQKILDTKAGRDKKNGSWMEDEDLVLFVKDWAKKTGENKYSGQYIPISNINTRSDVTSYAFAQFVGKYLHSHRPELAHDEIKT